MKKYIFITIILISSVWLYADQAAWITKEQAERGAALIKSSGLVRHFCAPCGDNFFKGEKVFNVIAAKAGGSNPDDQYYEVQLNGNGIDLAYVYILSGGKWLNVAMALNIPVESVPRFLSDDVPSDDLIQEELPSEENIEDYDGSADYPIEEGN